MKEVHILSEEEIMDFIILNPDWSYEGTTLQAKFKFTDFLVAMQVVQELAVIAEEMNHHPEWTNVYNNLSIRLCTHEVGNMVTSLDRILAERISKIVAKQKNN